MPRKRIHADPAARLAAYRSRHNLVAVTVNLPVEVVDGLSAYMRFKNLTKDQVFEKLITSQLLRKR